MHRLRDLNLALMVGDGADAIVPAKRFLDGLEGVLVDSVGVEVQRHGAREAREMVEHEMPIGAAEVDDGPVAHALLEQIVQRRAEIACLHEINPNDTELISNTRSATRSTRRCGVGVRTTKKSKTTPCTVAVKCGRDA